MLEPTPPRAKRLLAEQRAKELMQGREPEQAWLRSPTRAHQRTCDPPRLWQLQCRRAELRGPQVDRARHKRTGLMPAPVRSPH